MSGNQLTILRETADYVVVYKPYDMCINGEKEKEKYGVTVASILSDQRPELVDSTVASGFRFPHQLDYATSGVLCITLNKECTREASKLFKERKVVKEYLAVVHGHVKAEHQVIQYSVGENLNDATGFSMTINKAHCSNPKVAETRLSVIEKGYYKEKPATKLSVRPITGRRHQIRVHCSGIGHPIIGDYTYSGKTDTEPERMMLHSWKLNIPLDKDPIDVTCTTPFTTLLNSQVA